MVAPSYVTAGASPGSGSTASLSVDIPAGSVIGQIAVIVVYSEDRAPNSLPSGFAQAASAPSINPTGRIFYASVLWKRLTAADSGTYTVGFSASTFCDAQCYLFKDTVESGSPWGATSSANTGSASETTTSPITAVTTTGNDRLLVHVVGSYQDLTSDGTGVVPSGFTLRGAKTGHMLSTKTQDNLGATGNITASFTPGAASGTTWAVWLGELLPKPKPSFLPFFM